MKHYSITIHAGEAIEKAINQEVRATFELHAISETAAKNRAMKMMGYVVDAGFDETGVAKYALLEPAVEIGGLEQVFILMAFDEDK